MIDLFPLLGGFRGEIGARRMCVVLHRRARGGSLRAIGFLSMGRILGRSGTGRRGASGFLSFFRHQRRSEGSPAQPWQQPAHVSLVTQQKLVAAGRGWRGENVSAARDAEAAVFVPVHVGNSATSRGSLAGHSFAVQVQAFERRLWPVARRP